MSDDSFNIEGLNRESIEDTRQTDDKKLKNKNGDEENSPLINNLNLIKSISIALTKNFEENKKLDYY